MEKNHFEDQGVNGRMGPEWMDVEWIQLVQDRVRWRVVENAVMNLRVLAPRS
jgi:hypothetical protein